QNALNFPAAILEPPFFDPNADDAANHGAIGAVIGHEIVHGFDNLGADFNAQGKLENWWSEEDMAHVEEAGRKLAAQYDAYEPQHGLHINGEKPLDQNIAPRARLKAPYQAYLKTLGGEPPPELEGLSGQQRFFITLAQTWRNRAGGEALR